MHICYAVLLLVLWNTTLVIAQSDDLTPSWELQLDSAPVFQHHASGGLVSVRYGDSLTFFDVWTGDSVTTRLNQGVFCFVDTSRSYFIWTETSGNHELGELLAKKGSFDSDTSIARSGFYYSPLELKPYQWRQVSSSRTNLVFTLEDGDYWTCDQQSQSQVFIVDAENPDYRWSMSDVGHIRPAKPSRSGRLCGGIGGYPLATQGFVVFSGLDDKTYVRLLGQTFAWLDDINNLLIATGGIYAVTPGLNYYAEDSLRFLRALPTGWFWHAPFADWTYALGCKSDSSQVSIVSLVTDSIVANCIPTSRRVDTIYSDVQRNYVITYDAQARVLSGFIVDTTLIPSQVISGVEDDRHGDVVGQEASDFGLLRPNPADDVVSIPLPTGTVSVTLYSTHGESKAVQITPFSEVVEVSLRDVSPGVYSVIVNTSKLSHAHLLHIAR